jgi:hypothetical protein
MLYDRPVSQLMVDAAMSMPERFAPADVVTWFAEHYPAVKDTTVRAHVIGLTANDPSRHHYGWLAGKTPLFFKLNRALLTRFDPDSHFFDVEEPELELVGDDSVAESAAAESMEFYLEVYLEEFLLTNWHLIDWGRPLRIWQGPNGESGHQLSTPVGRLDFLCVDSNSGALVAVELKRGLPSDRVVGQIARYMGWIRNEMAQPGQPVEGLIVTHESEDRLNYAVSAVQGLGLLLYEVAFSLRRGDLASALRHGQ